jgi:hypothetical protein
VSIHAQILGRGAFALTVAALAVGVSAGAATAAPPAAPEMRGHPPVQLTGTVWIDVNHDGLQDTRRHSEPGLPGVLVVALLDGVELPSTAPQFTLSRSVASDKLKYTRTNEHGVYTFTNLGAAKKAQVLVVPNISVEGPTALKPLAEQLRLTKPNVGKNDAIDSDFTQQIAEQKMYYGQVKEAALAKGKKVVLDAGLIDPAQPANNGVVCVKAFNDRNRNGVRDAGEGPIAGLPVRITTAPKPEVALKSARLSRLPDRRAVPITDRNGRYCFPPRNADTYRALIRLGPLTADGKDITVQWTLTKKDVGKDDTVDSDFALVTGSGEARLDNKAGITDDLVVKDDTVTTVDAGLYRDEPTPSATPAPPTGGGSLPVTGAAAGGILAAGALLLGGGLALTVAARRRRRNTV